MYRNFQSLFRNVLCRRRLRSASQSGGVIVETIFVDLNVLDESSKRELARYRELGPVQSLQRMKYQEQRRRKRLRTIEKVLTCIIGTLVALLAIWIFISWIDVFTHNRNPDPIYQTWNFFQLLR